MKMRLKAFSAGVAPGGLRDKNEIRILICYMIQNFDAALTKNDITLVLQAYGLANYFEVSEAFCELETNGSIEETEKGFKVTSQGKMIVEELSKSLPLVVRDKALMATKAYLERKKIEKENKAVITENDYGYDVTCTVSGGEFDMLKLTLYAPDKEFADAIKANFYKNPGEIYNRILSLFIDKK